MDGSMLQDKLESELVTRVPEPTGPKIMRRSVLVVIAIVVGLAFATCHLALTMASLPWLDLLLVSVLAFFVVWAFSRASPERYGIFAVAVGVPPLFLAIGYALAASDVASSPLWYIAPLLWLGIAGVAALLGRAAGEHRRAMGEKV